MDRQMGAGELTRAHKASCFKQVVSNQQDILRVLRSENQGGRRHPASPRHCYLTMIMKPFGLTERTMLPSTTRAPFAHSGLSIRFTVLPVKSIPLVSA